MQRLVLAAGLVSLITFLRAQSPGTEPPVEKPILQNSGKPMTIDFHCGEEDIRLAGMSCTFDDPCPVYLELSSVENVGTKVFLAGNIHSSSTTLYSILLASTDAGKTWHEPYERIRLAGLDKIQFIDFETGWIAGETQHPLPRDPFLLVTSDGGKSWQPQPLFGDPQFGSVQQFWFSSPTNGSIVIDRGSNGESGRYELYETSNGGATWTLRQTADQPLPVKHAIAAPPGWRLRADRPSKSYHVERRSGEAWRSIAAFSVAIGACKPEELPAPQPAPAN